MNDLRIIDADGHVQEKDAPWEDLLEEPYRKHAPRVVKDASGRSELLLEGKIGRSRAASAAALARRQYPADRSRLPVCSIRCNG